MFNNYVDVLEATIAQWEAYIKNGNFEIVSLSKAYAEKEAFEEELNRLLEKGFYGTIGKKYVINA